MDSLFTLRNIDRREGILPFAFFVVIPHHWFFLQVTRYEPRA
jgi:hypothetical protein